MIRREDISSREHADAGKSLADVAAEAVKCGESVRIVGLGTLARAPMCSHTPPARTCQALGFEHCAALSEGFAPVTYRLTLTTLTAKSETDNGSPGPGACSEELLADARHLARALGAPVEVWSPNRSPKCGCGGAYHAGALITTVQP